MATRTDLPPLEFIDRAEARILPTGTRQRRRRSRCHRFILVEQKPPAHLTRRADRWLYAPDGLTRRRWSCRRWFTVTRRTANGEAHLPGGPHYFKTEAEAITAAQQFLANQAAQQERKTR